jgi:hypothetical protein
MRTSAKLNVSQPAKLKKQMQALFYSEAAKYHALPLDNDRVMRLNPVDRPSLTLGRTSYTYYAGTKRIPEGVAPDMKNKSWSMTAKEDLPASGAEGMIATLGGCSTDGRFILIMENRCSTTRMWRITTLSSRRRISPKNTVSFSTSSTTEAAWARVEWLRYRSMASNSTGEN